MHSNDHQLNLSEKQQNGYCVVCLGQSGGAYKTSLLAPKELAYCPQSQCGIVSMAGSGIMDVLQNFLAYCPWI
jgi:hypothetical protein